jgi:hypothetical protein
LKGLIDLNGRVSWGCARDFCLFFRIFLTSVVVRMAQENVISMTYYVTQADAPPIGSQETLNRTQNQENTTQRAECQVDRKVEARGSYLK